MTVNGRFIVGSAGLCFLLLSFGVTSVTLGDPAGMEVRSLRQVSKEKKQVDIAGGSLALGAASTSSKTLSVGLSLAEYQCRFSVGGKVSPQERTINLFIYDLESTDKANPYSRAICVRQPVRGFALFPGVKGENYLAWARGSTICIEEVSQPREISEAVASYVSGKPEERYLVPVSNLVGREPFEGLDAINSEIEIVSVHKNAAGSLRLAVRSTKTKEVFSFQFDGKDWVRLSEEAAP